MKKALLTLAVVVATSVSVFAQGTIVFNNLGGKLVKWAPGTPKAGANVVAADGILVQLLWVTPGGGLEPVGAPVSTWPVPTGGVFNGGQRSVATANTTAPGWTWQIRAWQASYGTDWQTSYGACLAGGGFVQKPVNAEPGGLVEFRSPTGDPGASISPVGMAAVIPEFQIANIPEPSVIALGVLGLGALLMLRRRS
jgi:hypothetical protein